MKTKTSLTSSILPSQIAYHDHLSHRALHCIAMQYRYMRGEAEDASEACVVPVVPSGSFAAHSAPPNRGTNPKCSQVRAPSGSLEEA